MSGRIMNHTDLEVYKRAFALAMRVFALSQEFPKQETYALTDQMRRASRSVCANLAEGWRRRIYEAAFIAKWNEAEGEAAETQTWLEFAVHCGYITPEAGKQLHQEYGGVIASLVTMRNNPHEWVLPSGRRKRPE